MRKADRDKIGLWAVVAIGVGGMVGGGTPAALTLAGGLDVFTYPNEEQKRPPRPPNPPGPEERRVRILGSRGGMRTAADASSARVKLGVYH
jgi:hypothetical protein